MNTIIRHRLRLIPTPLLYSFPKSPFLQSSFSFSTTTFDPVSFTLSYLTNTCGFSHEDALKLSKRLRFNTAHGFSVISFFRTHGFSAAQIYHIFNKVPDVMLYHPTRRILPKFHFLASKGASPSDTVLIVSKNPRFLHHNFNNRISSTFQLLRTFFPSDHEALAVLIACPNIITDYRIASNVDMLLEAGVTHSGIRHMLLSRPLVLCSNLRTTLEEVKLLGCDPLKLNFVVALEAKWALPKSLWDAKVDALKKWGWSEDEVLVAFRIQPSMMLHSSEKLNAVTGIWVGRLGWDRSVLIAYPSLFFCSLEKRIVPRALVLEHLLSKGLVRKDINLYTPFRMTDEVFLQKYVKRFEQETLRLLELYREGDGTCQHLRV